MSRGEPSAEQAQAGVPDDPDLNAFASFGRPPEGPHHWIAAFGSSSIVYVVLLVLLVTVGTATKRMVEEQPVEIKFVETVQKEIPPPPPPPKVEVQPPPKAAPPPAAAPVVPKDMKVRKLDAPPPPKELVAPKDMPLTTPQEADPSLDKGIAVYGEGAGDAAGLEGGMAGGVAGGALGAIELPEGADPPKASRRNRRPMYPQVALAEQRTGLVILKVVITAEGQVDEVQVVRGEEPFTAAAVATVKKWRYEPARYNGAPIAVYRIIQIPFRLETATG
ncbi:MAG: energy transducer TonB [Candidatus Binatia bacterium]